MAALGAGAGGFTGDIERRKLALQERQQDINAQNQAVQNDQNQQRIDLAAEHQQFEQGWNNAIRSQEMANREQEFQKRSLDIERLRRAGDEESRQMANLAKMRETSLGNALIAGEMNGGFLKNSQLAMFNQEHQTSYDSAGMFNPITGRQYDDGRWHFLQFQKDNGGNVVFGNDGSPVVERDIPVASEFRDSVLGSEFGKMYMGRNNGSASVQAATIRGNTARDVAHINADSREKVAKIGADAKVNVADKGNASRERIEEMREKGREARAKLRNDAEWEKLAQGWAKIDDNFAIQAKKADTYGKRVDLLEQKLKNDYELGIRRAESTEEKNRLEAEYRERKADIDEGNLDLGWFRAENYADLGERRIKEQERSNLAREEQNKQNEEGRNRRFDERQGIREKELELKKETLLAKAKDAIRYSTSAGSAGAKDLARAKQLQGLLNGGNLTREARINTKNELNEILMRRRGGDDAGNATAAEGNSQSNSGDNSGMRSVDEELTKRGYRKVNGKWVK